MWPNTPQEYRTTFLNTVKAAAPVDFYGMELLVTAEYEFKVLKFLLFNA